jgi:eukaryotic-like serine/threonine-protein kinase
LHLTPGTRIGPFEITALIGAGGMGEVYCATDTNLRRAVAIKVLPASLSSDPDRLARFQREAQVLAALNHPHISQIHGLEKSDGITALVMELVEGPTLADRIAQGAVPLDDALTIAKQIAEALEAAHGQGIIHRDLKPANIKVRPDGFVKVLDFGLAKAMEPVGSGASVSLSPTITSPAMTHAGIILGTAAYMSPEQARGKSVDKRTDIWAFGCVLYELLTGRRAFGGDEVSDVLASILLREPDLAALPAVAPPSIRRLLRRCLEKDQSERLRDIGDARIEIRDALSRADAETAGVARAGAARHNRPWLAALGAVLAVAFTISVVRPFGPSSVANEMRVEITTPPTLMVASVAISPDGRAIAYVGDAEGQSRLWLRSLESGSSRAIRGTDGAGSPFWSPDGRSIGFFEKGKLKRVDVDGGSVQTLANAPGGTGGSWNRDDVILFAALGESISRISASGGEPVAVPALAREGSDFAPHFLPDGRHFLYFVRGSPEIRGVYVGRLDQSLQARRLLASDTGAVYASTGHLLFVRGGALYAQAFDPDRLTLAGNPLRLAEDVASDVTEAAVSVSNTGAIAFRSRSAVAQWQFVWFDRAGREITRMGDPSPTLRQPSLSPDDQRVVLYRGIDGNIDIWVCDTKRGAFSRITTDPADDVMPVWSPDGSTIVFSSNRTGVHNLYQVSVTGDRSESLLLSSAQTNVATHWSADGRFLLFNSRDPKGGTDIWALPLNPKGKPFPVIRTAFDEEGAQFSPDGNWIAYQSDKSGRPEIYVTPFPGHGTEWLISTNGGTQVRWGPDGKELFYVAANGQLTTVPIRVGAQMRDPEIGTPVALFTPPLGRSARPGDYRHQYMVASDSQRILVTAVKDEAATPPITLILNWKPQQ